MYVMKFFPSPWVPCAVEQISVLAALFDLFHFLPLSELIVVRGRILVPVGSEADQQQTRLVKD